MTRQPGRNVPETPFGARLRAARKMAGLSMEDLAGKLGGLVTKQAISKYEQGQMLPSPEVLEKLVEVLKIATWGASPLRDSEKELEEARSVQSPALFAFEAVERPMFRRTSSLNRLRKKDKHSLIVTGAGEEQKQYFSVVLNRIDASVRKSAEEAGSNKLSEAQSASPVEGFSPLADRRARLARDWDSGAGLDEIRFRTGERLSAKTGSALRYRIAGHLQKYLELESVLGLPVAFENPIAGRPARGRAEVEAAAAEVRRRWELGSGPVVNLLGLLEDKGIKVYETRGIDGFEGLSGRYGELPFVAVSMERPADRIRFTAAHELGHMLCDFEAAESPEGDCHAFGAAFLLPRAALETAFTPSRRKVTLGDLGEIKETYGVSLQAIMYRAHALGLISDRQLRSFRETIKAKGWMMTEPVAYTGKEHATRFRRLLHYAVAADILDVARAAEMAGVPAGELEKEIGDIF
jgi:Zn-dependent peptidase ImmA (M78 family)/transcriptional regulator with XRE-family HTH domain